MSSHDSNARLVDLIRAGLSRADELGRARVPLTLYPAEEQEELLTLLHAYLWDTAAPYDDGWHRSPGNIMTLWAELLEIGTETRQRLIPLRTDLVKVLTDRGLDHWGRYVDEYARLEGRWWIIRRNVSIDGLVKGAWSDRAKDTK